MYIPADNVYHEIVGGGGLDDVLDYAWGRRVILTSPNTLYAYLVIVLQGLLGLEVERSSRDMLAKLTRLELDIEEFAADYDVLGKHLRNAQSKYDDGLPQAEVGAARLACPPPRRWLRPGMRIGNRVCVPRYESDEASALLRGDGQER